MSAVARRQQKSVAPSLWLKRWSALWSGGFALGVVLFFGSFAYRAWRIAGLSPSKRLKQAEAMLRFVGDQIANRKGVEQFERFLPEAGCVAYMIYGEALVSLGVAGPTDVLKRAWIADEIQWCLGQLSQPDILKNFPNTQVPNGLFFLSRRTLLLAGLHLISDSPPWELTEEYHDNCQQMADAFKSSPRGLLDSFPDFCGTADNIAALRCLRLHDEKFGTDYSFAVDRWREWARGALDPRWGTLPATADPQTGQPIAPARGSSLALSLLELRDVDQDLFREQYLRFRKYFGNSFLGLQTSREFPEGAEPQTRTEIDTGPVLHGHGVFATIIGMTAARLAGDLAAFCDVMGLIEVIGLPSTEDGMRRYLHGKVVVWDAFAAYAMAAVPWTRSARAIPQLSTAPKRPWFLVGVLMAFPFLTVATGAFRYARLVRKIRPLSLWRSKSPSPEGIVLFWCQASVLVWLFFSILSFPVAWAGFGIVARGILFGLRLLKQRAAG